MNAVKEVKDRFQIRREQRTDDRLVEVEVEIDAPRDAVWRALTEADELTNWFPMQARVEPGEGGNIFMSWNGQWESTNRIHIWQPGEYLRTSWYESAEPDASAMLVDYYLQDDDSDRGGTRLRLVHHGFSKDSDWDEMYDGVYRGWSYELRSLLHYLEHHRGAKRTVAHASRDITGSVDQAWSALLSNQGLAARGSLFGLSEGDAYDVTTATGDALSGQIIVRLDPHELGVTVANRGQSLLRASIERCGDAEGPLSAQLWFASWGDKSDALGSAELQRLLDDALGACQGQESTQADISSGASG